MPTFRRQVAQLLTDPTRLIPRGGPPAAASTGGTAVATVRSEVWDAPIDDLYTDKGGDTLPAVAALAWANAHAARARGAAESADARAARIEAALARVEQKLDILLHRPTGPTVDVDASAITAAVQTAAAGVFGAGLDITGRATPARPALTEKGTPS